MTGRWASGIFEHGVSRRRFLKAAGTAAIFASSGTLGCIGGKEAFPITSPLPAASPAPEGVVTGKGIVVAVDSDPVRLVDKAIDAFGGLSGIVKKGDRVLIKANFSFARTPEQGACNHPDVLVRIMQRCAEAGASDVTVMDHTIDNPRFCLERSGIKAAVESAGFNAVAVQDRDQYVEKPIPGGVSLKATSIANILMDADVFINVPVIKSHSMSVATGSLKNIMGVVYERTEFHYPGPLDMCIADLNRLIRPDLVIADAYRMLKTGGPGGSDPDSIIINPNTLIIGRDPVAVDSYAVTLIGLKPEDVPHIMTSYMAGIGERDLSRMDVLKV